MYFCLLFVFLLPCVMFQPPKVMNFNRSVMGINAETGFRFAHFDVHVTGALQHFTLQFEQANIVKIIWKYFHLRELPVICSNTEGYWCRNDIRGFIVLPSVLWLCFMQLYRLTNAKQTTVIIDSWCNSWFYSLYSNYDNSGRTNDVNTIYLSTAVHAALSIKKVWSCQFVCKVVPCSFLSVIIGFDAGERKMETLSLEEQNN